MNATLKMKPEISFETTRFGVISIAQEKVIRFARAIPGFERLRSFILIDHDAEGLLKWLQSTEDPAVAFLLTDPLIYKPDYRAPLRKTDMAALGATDAKGIVTMVMVCVSEEDKTVSLNLKGPLIFNSANMSAVQCIIDREDYPSDYAIKF